jgi:hypothetical protein
MSLVRRFHYRAYGLCLDANRLLPRLMETSDGADGGIRVELAGTRPFPIPLSRERYLPINAEGDVDGASPLTTSLLVAGDGARYFRLRFGGDSCIEFTLDAKATKVWATWSEVVKYEDVAALFLRPVFARILWLRGIISLHASAVAINNRAIAFVGGAGAGKSTTAAAFARRGHAVLTDDVAALDAVGAQILVQPSVPALWLLPNVASELVNAIEPLPPIWTHEEKRHLELRQSATSRAWQFQAQPLPLAAIYILGARRAGITEPSIVPVPPTAAFFALVANSYGGSVLDTDRRRRQFELFSRISAQIPVRYVVCPNELSQLSRVCDVILADVGQASLEDSAPSIERNRMQWADA